MFLRGSLLRNFKKFAICKQGIKFNRGNSIKKLTKPVTLNVAVLSMTMSKNQFELYKQQLFNEVT